MMMIAAAVATASAATTRKLRKELAYQKKAQTQLKTALGSYDTAQ